MGKLHKGHAASETKLDDGFKEASSKMKNTYDRLHELSDRVSRIEGRMYDQDKND